MDWKSHYRKEVESAGGRDAVRSALADWTEGDAGLVDVLRRGGIVSVPHTTIWESAEPLARVAQSIVAGRFPRVLALGVLHTSTLPEPGCSLAEELADAGPRAAEAYERLCGAFTAEPLEGLRGTGVRVDPTLLANEFSLDLFRAVLESAARAANRTPPRVDTVFVGPTRSPEGSFAAGEAVVDSIRPLLEGDVACVTTGDLVHFGHGYATDPEIAALPHEESLLTRHFHDRVREMLRAAFARADLPSAFDVSTRELRSDQRHLLPVLSGLVGQPAYADLLSFRLTDYSAILGQRRPCVVATALATFRRAG